MVKSNTVYDESIFDSYLTPLQAFYEREKKQASDICFVQPYPDGRLEEMTWQEVGLQVRKMAAYLKSLQLEPASKIALLSNNCAHWIIADIAIWMAGYVGVPLYPVLTAESIRPIMEHSEAQVIFVGKLEGWESMKEGVPDGVAKITLPLSPDGVEGATSWQSIMDVTEPVIGEPNRGMEELATIVYTSGTTGMPKGVMHSFRNLAVVGELTAVMYKTDYQDRMLSYLPLAHCAERAAVETNQLYRGFRVYFSNSLDTFADDLRRARPTLFFAVPRIWTKLRQRVLEQVPEKKLELLLRTPFVSRYIKNKLCSALGLNDLRITLSGAAPLSTSVIDWYGRLGINILEGYAMSENFAYSHTTKLGEGRVGYVGSSNPHVVCKISEQGEVLVKSPTNMMGYYKEPELTREALDQEGFLHTGDKGEIDSQDRLKITGRIKDIFKTSKGKYVAPAPIEDRLMKNSIVEQVCVAGSNLPQPLALVTLSEQALTALSDSTKKSAMEQEFQSLLSSVNPRLDKHENLCCLVVLGDSWTIDNNMMTPTLKIKRDKVEAAYEDKFSVWSQSRDKVIWFID